jgi:hypothetical protein
MVSQVASNNRVLALGRGSPTGKRLSGGRFVLATSAKASQIDFQPRVCLVDVG